MSKSGTTRRGWLARGSAVAAAVLAAACGDSQPRAVTAPQPTRGRMASIVTPAAAAALDASGRFALPERGAGGRYPEISRDLAVQLAVAWARDFGPHNEPFLRETHGGPIAFGQLAPCGRALYARSGFEAPSEQMPAPLRRQYGPWWLVTLCTGGTVPTVSVAVSAWATNLRVDRGHVAYSSTEVNGTEFFGIGVPLGHSGEYPTSPEAAASLAAAVSDARVAAVPELVMASPDQAPPQGARWALPLDRTVTLRGAQGAATAPAAFVAAHRFSRAGDAAYVPLAAQPAAVTARWTASAPGKPTPARFARTPDVRTEQVKRRADTPLRFELVTPAGGL